MGPTPSQTVGPYFAFALAPTTEALLVERETPGAIVIEGTVRDGAGEPVPDSMLEIWQAAPSGRYAHPADHREALALVSGFTGYGRCSADETGSFRFVTLEPGAVPWPDGGLQAPHISMSVFARGLLRRLATRIYFPQRAEENARDPLLSSLTDDADRATLIAHEVAPGHLRFDIRLQGEGQTVFLDV